MLKSRHIEFNPKLYDIAVENVNDTRTPLVNYQSRFLPSKSACVELGHMASMHSSLAHWGSSAQTSSSPAHAVDSVPAAPTKPSDQMWAFEPALHIAIAIASAALRLSALFLSPPYSLALLPLPPRLSSPSRSHACANGPTPGHCQRSPGDRVVLRYCSGFPRPVRT